LITIVLCAYQRFSRLGSDPIKLFWTKFANSFNKLDRFVTVQITKNIYYNFSLKMVPITGVKKCFQHMLFIYVARLNIMTSSITTFNLATFRITLKYDTQHNDKGC
jgi:hypothetical protein